MFKIFMFQINNECWKLNKISLNLNINSIIEVYEETKSVIKTAEHFNCCQKTICNYLDKVNYPRKYCGVLSKMANNPNYKPANKKNLNEEKIIKIYLELKSIRDTARYFNCSTPVIHEILKNNNIDCKNIGQQKFSTDRLNKLRIHGQQTYERLGWGNDNKHPNWRGGITKITRKIRNSDEYKEWRLKIFRRDYFTCQQCGLRSGNIQAHHKIPFSEIIINNDIKTFKQALNCHSLWAIDNGETLCLDCHGEIHPQIKGLARKHSGGTK